VATDAAEIPELLVGEVGIKDYGEKENDDLAKRFNVAKDDFPVAVLFVYGKDGKRQEYRFDGEFARCGFTVLRFCDEE
jgi:endoplasmic reticulum protein 29